MADDTSVGLEFRDLVAGIAFILSAGAFIRTWMKDKRDPIRQDLLRCVDELLECAQVLSDETQRYLEKSKEAKSYADLLREESACRRRLDAVAKRLPVESRSYLQLRQSDWWRIVCEAPWGSGNKRRKATDAEISDRREAHLEFSKAVDSVRRDVLSGKIQAILA